MARKPLKIGVTMRQAQDPEYGELRDAISRDWHQFFLQVFPHDNWMFIPNIEEKTPGYASGWKLDSVILSGGPDVGVDPVRDESEIQLLQYALEKNIPILGICRGLQLIVSRFGGSISTKADRSHVASTHPVTVVENTIDYPTGENVMVNSYHENLIVDCGRLTPFAYDAAGNVEAAYLEGGRCAGLMWHPERNAPVDGVDARFIQRFFHGDT